MSMNTIGEQIMAFARERKTFTQAEVRAALPVNPHSIGRAIHRLRDYGDIIRVGEGVYRAANLNAEINLSRLVIFGGAKREVTP